MVYLKSFFYNHILKCDSNKINETRCNSLLPVCKVDINMLSKTLEPDILQKIYVSTQEIRPECKVCDLRYRPIAQCSLYKNTIYYFHSLPKKNVIFDIYHLLFQNTHFFLVNSSNLMDTIKTIIVHIELLF